MVEVARRQLAGRSQGGQSDDAESDGDDDDEGGGDRRAAAMGREMHDLVSRLLEACPSGDAGAVRAVVASTSRQLEDEPRAAAAWEEACIARLREAAVEAVVLPAFARALHAVYGAYNRAQTACPFPGVHLGRLAAWLYDLARDGIADAPCS